MELNLGLFDLEIIIIEYYDIVFVIIYLYENFGVELKKNVFNRVLIWFVCFIFFVVFFWFIFYYIILILFVMYIYMLCYYIIWLKKSVNVIFVIFCLFIFLYVICSICKLVLSFWFFKWYRVVFNGIKLNIVIKYLYCFFYWYFMFRFDNFLNYL